PTEIYTLSLHDALPICIGHAEVRAYEREQRRKHQHVIVADQVGEAHAGDELGLARVGGGEKLGSLRHWWFWSWRGRSGRVRGAGVLDGAPDAVRRRRHVHVEDAE